MNWLMFQIALIAITLGFSAILIALGLRWYRSRSELRFKEFEVRHRLLEKFADSQAFLEFARSEEGRRLLLLTPPPAPSIRRSGIRLVQVGLLVLGIGIGAGIAAGRRPEPTEASERYAKENLSTWGTLFICAGIALTGSGVLSRWLDRR